MLKFRYYYVDNTSRKVGYDELIECYCGCGELIPNRNRNGLVFYKSNHKIERSIETKEKISLANSGDRNGMWKGNNVGYGALHDWIKERLPKPDRCEECDETPPYDLANISGKYLRNLNDWQWLCRRCHMILDGRMNNLVQYAK